MKKLINKGIFYFRRKFPDIKKTDYLLVSFPKTGSTFTRLVFGNIKSIIYGTPKDVNFFNLLELMPELGVSSLSKTGDISKMPRIIKTHDVYRNIFAKTKNYIYVIRDPRDTLISYYHYACAQSNIQFKGSINEFIKDEKYGLASLNNHIKSWSNKNPLIFKYEDLMENPLELFNDFFELNNIDISTDIISKAIELSRPDRMKKIEKEKGAPNIDTNFKKGFKFIRNAKVNQWKTVLDSEALRYIKDNATKEFISLGYKL